jgi:zinc and cadmium transporter
VADLIPQLQHRLSLKDTASQLAWLAGGLLIIVIATRTLHH